MRFTNICDNLYDESDLIAAADSLEIELQDQGYQEIRLVRAFRSLYTSLILKVMRQW
jgi:hypothetical protein